MNKQQQDDIALRQAKSDITRALLRLEQETGRRVLGVSIIEYRFFWRWRTPALNQCRPISAAER